MQSSPGVARGVARRSFIATLSLAALAALSLALIVAPSATAKKVVQGGISSSGLGAEIPESPAGEPPVEGVPGEFGTGESDAGPASRARLVRGRALAPANAPAAVKQVIAAANRIRTLPYIWGGGHRRWQDSGYDCSGAVSYALHGARLLASPLTSGSLESFGEAGAGRWITVYANAGHAYMIVAGLRFDTAGNTRGSGPRWHPTLAAAAGGRFVVRHPVGL